MVADGSFRGNQPRQIMRFSVVDGPRAGEILNIPLPEPGESPALIGRSRDCAIWIDERNISRRNTELLSSPDHRPMVRDMGSMNGTLVNAQPISQTDPLLLNPGDHLRIGLSELVFMGLVPDVPLQAPPPMPLASPPTVGLTLPTLGTTPPAGISPNQAKPTRAATLPGEYYIYLVMRNGQRYLLDGEEAIVGRGQANDIVIDSNSISRQHARLQRTPSGVYVSDLGSTNKTFVNGEMTTGPVLLRDGDVVRFGDVEADFRLEGQRMTNITPLVSRLPEGAEETDPSESTQKEYPFMDQTFVGNVSEQTYVGAGLNEQTLISGNRLSIPRRQYDQSETALDLDIKIVGRALRKAQGLESVAIKAPAVTASLADVGQLEGVYLTEGTGRAKDTLLNNVSLTLKAGELVALVGPSGSGKTELLQVMAGMQAADAGKVSILGHNLPTMESKGGHRPNLETDKELARWRYRALGYLPGEPELSPRQSGLDHIMWILEQAGFGRDPRDRMEKATLVLNRVGLHDPEIIRLLPMDLNRAERKQLALARVLALEPPLLLLDEPTGKVPSAAADKIFSLLRELARNGQTVFMVTSDPLWARNTDRQIEILDGAIINMLV